jgi:hypothetical protein
MTESAAALAKLLERAESADPANRIDLRDPIAAHGAAAIEAVTPWLRVPSLAAFAIRVIARAGQEGNREAALDALRQARRRVDARIRTDIDWAVGVLRVPTDQPAAPAKAATAPRPRPARARTQARRPGTI